jgi:hypothetical protein
MKTKLTSLVLALVSQLAFAGTPTTPAPVAPTAPAVGSEAWVSKAFATVVLDDGDESVGGGLSLEAPIAGALRGELTVGVQEDLYSVGGNFLYYVPVCSKASVYGLAGGAYEFDSDQWTVRVGGGLSYQLTETVNLFSDATYNFLVENDDKDGVVVIRAGLGFKF